MTEKEQNEQNAQEELRDLDVPEKDAEDVKGGITMLDYEGSPVVTYVQPPIKRGSS